MVGLLYRGYQVAGSLCAFSPAPGRQDLVFSGLGYDVGVTLHLSRFPLAVFAFARLGVFTCMDSKLSSAED